MTTETTLYDKQPDRGPAELLAEAMSLGRIPLIVMGSGMSAGVLAPTMGEIHEFLKSKINEKQGDVSEEHLPIIQTVQGLLGVLTSPKPESGWTSAAPPASPRSIQVRLYNLLQTSEIPALRKIWQEFGEALLLRKMVTRDGGEAFDQNKTLAELPFSLAHAWAAILAIGGRAVVASLNYDGLTRKAVDHFSGVLMSPPIERRRTCRIISTAEEISGFFGGVEAGLEKGVSSFSGKGKLPWQPVPVIKFRGDVFHAVCQNARCPETGNPTPLYFVLPPDFDPPSPDERESMLRKELRCKCCGHPRKLEISFPGVFDKEMEIDRALVAFHEHFGARLAGVVFLGFSGSWDESLVDYLASRAAKLAVPMVSVGRDETPSIEDAANAHEAKYFSIRYESKPMPPQGVFLDDTLEALIPVKPLLQTVGAMNAEVRLEMRAPEKMKEPLALVFPKDMFSFLSTGELDVRPSGPSKDAAVTFNLECCEAKDERGKVYSAALETPALKQLKACSQLGIKGLLLREENPHEHTRFRHSASAVLIARLWYEVLCTDLNAKGTWAASEEGCVALELAVLCHDTLHLPFSHMMEEVFRELNWGHRPKDSTSSIPRWTSREMPYLEGFEPALKDHLQRFSVSITSLTDWWSKVRSIQDGRTGFSWLEAIMDSALDADKIQYIFNDTKLTGQNVRLAEARSWIAAFLGGQSLTPEGLIRLEGESCLAAFELLRERAHLYRTLYLTPELRALECLARYIVTTWLEWKVPEQLELKKLQSHPSSERLDLRTEKSEAAGKLLWNLFSPPEKTDAQSSETKSKNVEARRPTRPQNELEGLEVMFKELTEGDIAKRLDSGSIDWLEQLWRHLDEFKKTESGQKPTIRDARRAFQKLSPRGPIYVHRAHEARIREIARLWRIHYPLLGLIDLASFPSFLATPSNRWERIGGRRVAAEHFLVPGRRPNEWRPGARATTPIHECDFEAFEYPVVQALVLDPYGDASGGGAFLHEMLLRELQRADIPYGDTPNAAKRR